MLSGLSSVRFTGLFLAMAVAFALWPRPTLAANAEVSLNVIYDDPEDPLSGGFWQIAAKSDGFGILSLQVLLTGIDFGSEELVGPRGFVNGSHPAGVSLLEASTNGSGFRDIAISQQPVGPGSGEESVFYGVGTITNGSPFFPGKPVGSNSVPGSPTFTTLSGTLGIPWAVDDPMVEGPSPWDVAAILLEGTFADGLTPGFFEGSGAFVSSAVVFTSVGSSAEIGNWEFVDEIPTTVRTNLTALGLPDYNQNGVVDAADYTVWRDALTAGSNVLPNDTTPGVVDESDFIVWRDAFGQGTPIPPGSGAGSGQALAAVPEPATSTLLLGVVGMLFLRPRIGRLRSMRFQRKTHYKA